MLTFKLESVSSRIPLHGTRRLDSGNQYNQSAMLLHAINKVDHAENL